MPESNYFLLLAVEPDRRSLLRHDPAPDRRKILNALPAAASSDSTFDNQYPVEILQAGAFLTLIASRQRLPPYFRSSAH